MLILYHIYRTYYTGYKKKGVNFMKKIIYISLLLLALIIPTLQPSHIQAAEEWLTINLEIDKNLNIECPIAEKYGTPNITINGKFANNQDYEVSCSLSDVKLVKNAKGIVTQIKVKKTDADKLIVNVTPVDSSAKIYSRYFQFSTKYGYQTCSDSYTAKPSDTQPDEEIFEEIPSYTDNRYTWSTVGAYHYQKYYSWFYLYESGNTSWGYTSCVNTGCNTLCIKDITEPGKVENSTFTVSFAIFNALEHDDFQGSNFSYSSNGSSSTTTSILQKNSIKFTHEAIVSSNNRPSTSNNWITKVKTALRSFENMITVATSFYIGISILTSFLVLMITTVKISTMPSHPIKRRETFVNLIYSIICFALTGGATLFSRLILQIIYG